MNEKTKEQIEKMRRVENDLPRPERTPVEELRDWELIQDNGPERTERLLVAGGFLYRTITIAGAVALVFVPES